MAIADTITSMQTHTSNAYTMIGYGTDITGINKNLANLSSTIFEAFLEALRTPDTLFTNLPKKSGTGANITLNDTANAPMRITLSPSELSQSGTPTPSSPQAVHTISGSNKVVVNGKNLFHDYSTTSETFHTIAKSKVSNGIKLNGTYDKSSGGDLWLTESKSSSYSSNMTLLKANTQYTISIQLLEGTMNVNNIQGKISSRTINNYTFAWNYKDLTFSNNKWTSTFTTGSSDIYVGAIRFVFNTSSTGEFTNAVLGIQVEENSTFTSYEPYISQEQEVDLGDIEYCKIGNYEDKFIRTSGKNLIDSVETHHGINGNTGAITTENAYLGIDDYVSCKPNTTYTISFQHDVSSATLYVGYKTQSGTYIERVSLGTTRTFTTPNNAYYMFAYVYYASGFSTIGGYVMLNKGSVALDYEPYGSNEWYIKKNIGKVVLDGTETWNITSTNTSSVYRKMTTVLAGQTIPPSSASQVGLMLCNRYLAKSANDTYLKNVGVSMASSGYLEIYDSDFTTNDVSLYKTWLSSNNVILYYVLSTPTYTKITGTLANQLENIYQKLLSYNGTTNISQVNNDLSFNLSVSAIESVGE